MKRAALYIRVSTDEQAQHGYSLEAQREALENYVNKHSLTIVDHYTDAGHSARKKYTARPEFMRMLRDVQENKIDIILFIKLDRWFRSVKDYYKIQEVLEAHNVGWKTTEEHYDTTTTNGRLHINIRLSVAQDESDRTSDRIKFVFENKIARGEVISGSYPPGLKIENKRLVHDEAKKQMVIEMFEHYAHTQNKYATHKHINEKYGWKMDRRSFDRLLSHRLYIGEHEGNRDFCEPIIDRKLFDAVQTIQDERNIKKTKTGRVYIFSGLVRCAVCGRSCAGQHARGYLYYRCVNAVVERRCDNRMSINEKHIEEWLVRNIKDKIKKRIKEIRVTGRRKKPLADKEKTQRKIERVKELFLNELITLEEYKSRTQEIEAQLDADIKIHTAIDTKAIEKLLTMDFVTVYDKLDRLGRQGFWRQIIREITIDSGKHLDVLLF
jgi:DNA invertase Pin-like site-specific DNA recombinase